LRFPQAHDADERILDGVRTQLLVARDRDGDAEERRISAPVSSISSSNSSRGYLTEGWPRPSTLDPVTGQLARSLD
jgi:hypothetical protein